MFPPVLIAYQVNIHNKFSKCHPPESAHACTRLIIENGKLSKVLGRLQMACRASNVHWGCVSSFSIQAEYGMVFKYPTGKNLKD
jgi:hypothetical protein